MNPGDDDDGTDWFAEAMDYAVGSPRAQDARKAAATRVARETALREIRETAAKNKAESAAKVADRLAARIVATPTPPSSAAKWAALKDFGIGISGATAAGTAIGGSGFASGGLIVNNPNPGVAFNDVQLGRRRPAITAEQGFEAILKAVRGSDDPFKSAGEWMTKITHGLAEIINESDEEK